MNRISSEILEYVRRKNLIPEGSTVYLAVSGGADSMAMALILKDLERLLKCNLFIINIEHGIRGGESKEDSDFVLNFASDAGIPAVSIPIDSIGFSKQNGMTLEEGARVLRYRTMAEFILKRENKLSEQPKNSRITDVELKDNNTEDCSINIPASKKFSLATAHHASDSVETMLFNMVRGTGLKGLAGIRPETEINGIPVIRPILPLTREEIESYLDEKGCAFRHDSTNDDDEISRNYIRHVIVPSFSKVNSNAVSNIFECSEKVLEASDYFSRMAVKAVLENKEKTGNGSIFDASFLFSFDKVLRPYIIFEWLRQNLISIKDVSDSHVNAILSIAISSQNSTQQKETDLPQNVTVKCRNGLLSLSYKKKNPETCIAAQEKTYGKSSCDEDEANNCAADGKETSKEKEAAAVIYKDDINAPVTIDFGNGEFVFSVFEKEQSEDFPRKNYTKWLDYDKISNALSVRYRKEGDRLQTVLGSDSIPLRRFFINEKIPREDRDSVPLLCDGSEVLWVVGLRLSERAKITESTKKVLAVEYSRIT